MIEPAERAACIEYAIRDVVVPATELEAKGHRILKLNIGDPLAYPGLPTPEPMIEAYAAALRHQENGYSPSYGLPALRQAIAADEQNKANGGWSCREEDVYVTTGVTEGLQLLFSAFLHPGDKVLAPGPHYPPYMAYPQMFQGSTVEYRLDPDHGWRLDLEDVRAKMDEKVKLLVVINPNNPTGGIASRETLMELLEIVRQWPQCTIISDEIYDGLNYSDSHVSLASLSPDVPVITCNGVSKVYYAPGWRIGYLALHDPRGRLEKVRDALEKLLRSRLCASTPAQLGYLAGLTGPKDWMLEYRHRLLQQRDYCMERIAALDGMEVEEPGGSFYMFPRLTHPRWATDDKTFVLDLLHQEKVLLVHGSGFSQQYGTGFVRLVFLPQVDVLEQAFDGIERFLASS
ncbi:MAG: aminotransferase class I/II-fold pyridoxal phosphate-dependent enzyme [Deltaproteobacteria bacterium]|nr:aminotransferase class I/II-fold pyridoxal phosphate-dependent enzyme [Deltaproteobacteria bacterium]